MNHPGIDMLTDIRNAVTGQLDVLEHVSGCDRCRNDLAALDRIAEALAVEVSPRVAFTDEVLAATVDSAPPASRAARLAGVLNPLFAAATALAVARMGVPSEPALPVLSGVAVLAAAAVVVLRSRPPVPVGAGGG